MWIIFETKTESIRNQGLFTMVVVSYQLLNYMSFDHSIRLSTCLFIYIQIQYVTRKSHWKGLKSVTPTPKNNIKVLTVHVIQMIFISQIQKCHSDGSSKKPIWSNDWPSLTCSVSEHCLLSIAKWVLLTEHCLLGIAFWAVFTEHCLLSLLRCSTVTE